MASKKLKFTSAATTGLTQIQQMGGNLRGIIAINTNAAIRYVKFYDSVDTPVVGTTVPVLTVALPVSNAMTQVMPHEGVTFKNSMWFAYSTGVADTDATAVGAGDIIGTVFYE